MQVNGAVPRRIANYCVFLPIIDMFSILENIHLLFYRSFSETCKIYTLKTGRFNFKGKIVHETEEM